MNRDLSGRFKSESYACEEARVEMAAAFVCNILGLPTDYANHAAYIATWLKKLKADNYETFQCAADAQRIADWTLGYHPVYMRPRIMLSDRTVALKQGHRSRSSFKVVA
jgi:antirestriction protein ArdC